MQGGQETSTMQAVPHIELAWVVSGGPTSALGGALRSTADSRARTVREHRLEATASTPQIPQGGSSSRRDAR
jgi:hypothetical protein